MTETDILRQQDKDLEQWKTDSLAYLTSTCGPAPWTDASSDDTREETGS
jgi:hypothetical protein